MAKLLFVLFALLALQIYIEEASSAGLHKADTKLQKDAKIEEAGPTLDSIPRGQSRDSNNNDGISSQGQRQKRFYNFNFGFTPYGPFNPTYVKRDNSPETDVYGTEDPLAQIFKRVQDILNYTRQQALSPPTASHIVPSYIPVFYIPQFGCGCTPDNNQGPSNDEERNKGDTPLVPSPPLTTTTMLPTINPAPAMPPAKDNKPENPTPDDDPNNTVPAFTSRLPDMQNEDGARPISFEPIKPDRPLSRPPPPVDHGSTQAGSNNEKNLVSSQDAPITTMRPPTSINSVPAQPDLPTNAIPTLCDGAVLVCCHRPEVTYDCFESQGCPDPMPSDNPCNENVILNVVRKFQYYYANRKSSNKLL
ncbi:uncharacterized protein [Epargyreus clarus]|uniref:uncharacterized protein n=1 Tax=Epargyreus clarus TaxID=520877 RepID=UPI003C2DF995